MESLRPNGQRAKNAIILIWIVLALEIISFVSGYFQYDLLTRADQGGFVTMDEATANDTREKIIGIIYLITFIVSGITFIMWFRRAYYNLHLRSNHLSDSDGWAAGSWFVPFVNLYRPYQIMKELYSETESLLSKKMENLGRSFPESFLGLWWALWIVNSFAGQFVFRYTMNAESMDEVINATIAGMVENVIGIPLALIAIKVVKDYASIEPLLEDMSDSDEEATAFNDDLIPAEV